MSISILLEKWEQKLSYSGKETGVWFLGVMGIGEHNGG